VSLKRWEVILIELMEPFQLVMLGGSQMEYLRRKAENWHEISHYSERISLIANRFPTLE